MPEKQEPQPAPGISVFLSIAGFVLIAIGVLAFVASVGEHDSASGISAAITLIVSGPLLFAFSAAITRLHRIEYNTRPEKHDAGRNYTIDTPVLTAAKAQQKEDWE